MTTHKRRPICVLALVLVLLSGCRPIGPRTIEADRFNYNAAISESWKQQMLLNMVRLRYGEAPVFLDVTSIIAQYSIEGEIMAKGGLNTGVAGDNTLSLGGGGRWSDRPTITYSPKGGRQFTASLLTPLPPGAIFALVQSGWDAGFVLPHTIQSINGINERIPGTRLINPEFVDALRTIADIESSGVIGLSREVRDSEQISQLVLRDIELDPEVQEKVTYLRNILGLDPTIDEFELVFGNAPKAIDEIAVTTNSVLEILIDLSEYFEVPPEHIADGWTDTTIAPAPNDPVQRAPIQVRYSREVPEHAFVAVQDRGYWFYIERGDLPSKGLFSFLMVLLALAESGEAAVGPVVTVGAGG